MAEHVPPTIHVRSLKTRYSFDGQTGIVTLKGTTGTVDAMTLRKSKHHDDTGRELISDPHPTLTIFWDASILQDGTFYSNPATYEGFQESDVDIHDVEFIEEPVTTGLAVAYTTLSNIADLLWPHGDTEHEWDCADDLETIAGWLETAGFKPKGVTS